MGTVAQNFRDIMHFQNVDEPLLFVKQILDGNHDGVLSLPEVASKINGSSAADVKTQEHFFGLFEIAE
jgi:hypothetical protein